MLVLRAIKRSPLALDLYAWSTWRGQMGGEYDRADNPAELCSLFPKRVLTVLAHKVVDRRTCSTNCPASW